MNPWRNGYDSRPPAFSRNGHGPAAPDHQPRFWQRARSAVHGTAISGARVLSLVWSTHAPLTMALAASTVGRSLTPAAELWLSKLLVDTIVAAVRSETPATFIPRVVLLAGIQIGLAVASSVLRTTTNISQQLLQERVAIRIQTLIMEQANKLDLAAFEDPKFYDHVQQAQRESTYRPVQMVSEFFGLVRNMITFLSVVGLLVRLNPIIAILALLSPVPAFLADSRYGWRGFQLMRRQSPLRRLMTYLTTVMTTDSFSKEVKVFTAGPYFLDRFRHLSRQYYQEVRGLLIQRYLAGFAWGLLSILAVGGAGMYVAVLALRSVITLGDFTLVTQAIGRVLDGFQNILSGFSSMYEQGLYVSVLFELMAYEPKIQAPEHPAPVRRPFEDGIEFRHVTFTYPGAERPALEDLTFTIQPGETVAIVGRNGAGKTTLVKLIARLYDPGEGQVLIDGRDVREYDPAELRREIGAIFQDYAEYQLTAGENIGVGRVEQIDREDLLRAAAERGGADDLLARLPQGFATVLGKWFDGGHQLSGGEWQKVALSRAFMRDAQILILDEPTSALDAQAEYDLFARIRELTRGKTAIFISHRFSTVRIADRILVIENGRLIEQGSHEELIARRGRYAELFELQASSYR